MNEEKPHSWLNGLAKQLHGREKVVVKAVDTDRTLTVTGSEYMEREPYRCNGWRIKMGGYGAEYELEIPEDKSRPPTLLWPSSDALGTIVRSVEVLEGGPKIVAEKTVEDLGIPTR